MSKKFAQFYHPPVQPEKSSSTVSNNMTKRSIGDLPSKRLLSIIAKNCRSIRLWMPDDQHLIASALKLVWDTLGLNRETEVLQLLRY